MRGIVLSVTILLTTGCATNFEWPTLSAEDDKEAMLLSETTRFAGLMQVSVRGEITDKLSPAQATPGNPVPAGWYSRGVAYYYRPKIREVMSIEPEPGKETCTNVAAHEVCHAKNPMHDLPHWECMNKWAQPTYGRP